MCIWSVGASSIVDAFVVWCCCMHVVVWLAVCSLWFSGMCLQFGVLFMRVLVGFRSMGCLYAKLISLVDMALCLSILAAIYQRVSVLLIFRVRVSTLPLFDVHVLRAGQIFGERLCIVKMCSYGLCGSLFYDIPH